MSKRRRMRFGLTLLVVGILGLAAVGSTAVALVTHASGTTIPVTSCSSYGTSGTSGTLAYALANYSSGDTIQFQCDGTIKLDSADGGPGAPISITDTLTLDATGHSVTLSGGNSVKVLSVVPTGNLTVNDLTIADGTVGSFDKGGGIYNGGTLTITGSTISHNSASAGYGAGIGNDGTLTITGSTISDNTATNNSDGGGIANGSTGTLTINTSTISGNTGASVGGGLFNAGGSVSLDQVVVKNNSADGSGVAFGIAIGGGIATDGGTLTITGSTITGNSAPNGLGGGIFGYLTTMTVSGSAITDNTVTGSSTVGLGGGIYSNGTLTVTGSTISGNTASGGGSGAGIDNLSSLSVSDSTFSGNSADFTGGAILSALSTSVTLLNTTIAGNTAGSYYGGINDAGTLTLGATLFAGNSNGDCGNIATLNDLGYNLDSDTSCGLSSAKHDQPGVTAPNIAALADNGGPAPAGGSGSLQTMALLDGSPAIGAIPNSTTATSGATTYNLCPGAPTTDERDISRPHASGFCSIGAYELVPPSLTTLNASTTSSTYGQTVTLRAVVSSGISQHQPSVTLGDPTGTVTFYDSTTKLGTGTLNGTGAATLTITNLSLGAHSALTAVYPGDTTYTGSTSAPLSLTVGQAPSTTTLHTSATSIASGQQVTLTAAVGGQSASPYTGTVTFYDGSAKLGTGTLTSGGVATFSTTKLSVGSHHLTATYSGDPNDAGSTSAVVVVAVSGTGLDGLSPSQPAVPTTPRTGTRAQKTKQSHQSKVPTLLTAPHGAHGPTGHAAPAAPTTQQRVTSVLLVVALLLAALASLALLGVGGVALTHARRNS